MATVEAPSVIIFDVFNTIVLPRSGHRGTFSEGLRAHGVAPARLPELQRLSEGLSHPEPSASRSAYVSWCAATLDRVSTLGVTADVAPLIVPALEQLHQGPMEPLPGVTELLAELRHSGIKIAVCSNWSWDLADDLADCGLLRLIDIVVPSARAGYRKPHPEIYRQVLRQAGGAPRSSLFIGDSLTADVLGPERLGIRAVHLLRSWATSTARRQITDIAHVRRFAAIPQQRPGPGRR
jgi:putative hydrolase of the HAD superfamily